jgi:hypothetical protein
VTLLEGDHVQFNISTDRRDKLERATNIDILPDTFHFTKESREMVRTMRSMVRSRVHLRRLFVEFNQ